MSSGWGDDDVQGSEILSEAEAQWGGEQAPYTSDWNRAQMRAQIMAEIGARAEVKQDEAEEITKVPSSPPTPPKRRDIDDCIAEISARRFRELPHFGEFYGDCLIFIDPPSPLETDTNEQRKSVVNTHYCKPFRIDSKKVRALNSPYLRKRLGPQNQEAILRKRGLRNDELPPGVKYVLDLTPRTEGDEAVRYMMDLSCPPGVLLWGLSVGRWDVSPGLAGGFDEFTEGPDQETTPNGTSGGKPNHHSFASRLRDGKSDRMLDLPSSGEQLAAKQPSDSYQVPPEYTPLRHRASIERIFLAALEKDPQLDSAPKLYSAVMASKGLEIHTNPLTDYVVRWLRADPNTRFLEALPEVSLEIAEGLKSEPICKDSFAVLVGEAALEIIVGSRKLALAPKGETIHGRKCGDINESWLSRLEYARTSLVDRVRNCFQDLVGKDMSWVEELPCWKSQTRSSKSTDTLSHAREELLTSLKDFIRGSIYCLLCSEYESMDDVHLVDRPKGEAGKLFPWKNFKATWDQLKHHERIFTRSFWGILNLFRLRKYDGPRNFSNMDVDTVPGKSIVPYPTTTELADLKRRGVIKTILFSQLEYTFQLYHQALLPEKQRQWGTAISWAASKFPSFSETPTKSSDALPDAQSSSKRRRHEDDDGNVTALPITTVSSQQNLAPLQASDSLPIRTKKPHDLSADIFEVKAETPEAGVEPSEVKVESPKVKFENSEYVLPKDGLFNEEPLPQHLIWSKTEESYHDDRYWNADDVRDPRDIDLRSILIDADNYVHRLAREMLAAPQGGQLGSSIDANLTNVLLCLTDSETKYLPLWAGGFDDGTAGVFGEFIPPPVDTFMGPTVSSQGARSSSSASEFDLFEDKSTVGTSTVVNDGFSDTIDRRKVILADDMDSDSWSAVGSDAVATSSMAAGHEKDNTEFSDYDMTTPTGNENAAPLNMEHIRDVLDTEDGHMSEAVISSFDDDNYDDIFHDDDDANVFDVADSDIDANDDDDMDESYDNFDADESVPATSLVQSTAAPTPIPTPSKGDETRATSEPSKTVPRAAGGGGVGDEIRSKDANVWIVYKDSKDPEEEDEF